MVILSRGTYDAFELLGPDPLRAVSILMRKVMGPTAVSAS